MWPTPRLIVHRGMEMGSLDKSEKWFGKYSSSSSRKSQILGKTTFKTTRENFTPPSSDARTDSGPVNSCHSGVQRIGWSRRKQWDKVERDEKEQTRGLCPSPWLRYRRSGVRISGPPSWVSLPFFRSLPFISTFFFSFHINPRARVLSCFSCALTLRSHGLWPTRDVNGILQERTLEWVATASSRGPSQHRDWTHISYFSYIGRWVL